VLIEPARGLQDHNPNRPLASSQLLELQGRLPAVPLDYWRPLVPTDARTNRCGTDPVRTERHRGLYSLTVTFSSRSSRQ
jgi:hypothetical protein